MTEARFERAVLAGDLAGWQRLTDEEWLVLSQCAVAEGVEGLLYLHSVRQAVAIPDEVRYAWQVGYRSRAMNNFSALQSLGGILAELARQGIDIVVLPGAPLLEFYPDPGCRPMDDIDLLVRPEQVPATAALLANMGFSSPDRYADIFVRNSLVLDVHEDLFHCGRIDARRYAGQLDLDQIWSRRQERMVEGVQLWMPCLEDMVLYTAVHALRHSYRRLAWFADLRLLIDQDLDWPFLFARARSGGLERPLAYGLKFLQQRELLPVHLLSWLEDCRLSGLELWLLQRAFADRRSGELGDLLWSLNVAGGIRRLQFLLQTYFPQPSVLLQVFPFLPRFLFPLAYGLRLGQLLFRGGRQLVGLVRKT